jgi:hypothetical protein
MLQLRAGCYDNAAVFSERSALDRTLNAWASAVAARRAASDALLDLTLANPTAASLPYADEEIRRALTTADPLRYDPRPFGLESARIAVAEDWARRGFRVQPARIALTSSTSEAYSFLFKLLCDAGDEVLVPAPSYPLFDHLARFDEVRITSYPLRYDGEWHIVPSELAERISTRTRAVLLVSPNNPTGSFVKREELRAIAGFGLPLISDEVFADFAFGDDDARMRSVLEAQDVLVFSLGGLSKCAGLPQLKLAWTTAGGPPELVDEALARLELIADAYLSPSSLVQHALPALLRAGSLTRDAIRQRTSANLARVLAATRGSCVTPLRVEGGWYAALRLPRTRSEEEWALSLLERCGVLIQPGWFYDFEQEPIAVASLLTPESEFATAIERLVSYVDEDSLHSRHGGAQPTR